MEPETRSYQWTSYIKRLSSLNNQLTTKTKSSNLLLTLFGAPLQAAIVRILPNAEVDRPLFDHHLEIFFI